MCVTGCTTVMRFWHTECGSFGIGLQNFRHDYQAPGQLTESCLKYGLEACHCKNIMKQHHAEMQINEDASRFCLKPINPEGPST